MRFMYKNNECGRSLLLVVGVAELVDGVLIDKVEGLGADALRVDHLGLRHARADAEHAHAQTFVVLLRAMIMGLQ